MFRRFVFFILALITSPLVSAQSPAIENLILVLSRTAEGKTQCDILHQLASHSWDYNFEDGLSYAQKSYALASSIQYAQGISQSLTDMGSYNYYQGDYVLAMDFYRKALRASQALSLTDAYHIETFVRMANIHRVQGAFDSAEYYFKKAEVCLKSDHASREQGLIFHSRGILHYELADFKVAKSFFERALEIRLHVKDSMQIGESWKTLGLVFMAYGKFDSAEIYFDKVKQLARRHRNTELLIFTNIHRGEIYFRKGDYIKSMNLFNEALDSLKHHPFKRYQAIVLKNIGQIFEWQGDYENALEFFYNSLKIDEATNSRQEMARTHDMMGWVYVNQKDYSKALQEAKLSGKIFRDIHDQYGLSDYYTLRGFIAKEELKYKQALQFYDSAVTIRKQAQTPIQLTNTLNFISEVHIAQGNYDEAIKYEEQIFAINQAINNRNGVAHYYYNMSVIMQARKNYGLAEQYALKSLNEAVAVPAITLIRMACRNLSSIYKATNNFKQALFYADRYIVLSDSLYTAEGVAKQAELNTFYELDKHQREIAELKQQSELQRTSIKAQQNELRFKNLISFLAILGCILLASLVVMLYKYLRAKTKSNNTLGMLYRNLQEQKEEMQAQSEDLTDGNQTLVRLNYQLIEKTEEIQAQSEELRETNEMVQNINRDLDEIVIKRTGQLKEAYKELDTFFYRSSHDFRRPLTTFMGLAEVAKITVKDANALELFEKVNETARSLDKMLIKLQSVSDVGAQLLIFKEVMVKEIFITICESFRSELERKEIKIISDINLPYSFISYPAMIKIILENLIENAIQFCTPDKPFIKFKALHVGNNCVMEIEDNGSGIPVELHDRIFEMYFRGSERSKGNGLGLYIVKKAVEKLSGTIRLDTAITEGSRFVITLPINDAEMNRL